MSFSSTQEYNTLHKWLQKRRNTDICEMCNKTSNRIEAANITGTYSRNLKDYRWLCVKCHRRYDGLYDLIKQKAATRRENRVHCKNGHNYEVYGFYTEKNGGKRCKKCQSIASRKYYQLKQIKEKLS